MSMSDPIAAMLTIIRNGQMVNKAFVCTDMSSKKESQVCGLSARNAMSTNGQRAPPPSKNFL